MKLSTSAPRILDFDIENRPLSYLSPDYTSGEVTAIAWKFIGERGHKVMALGEVDAEDMLNSFYEAFEQADVVTGHYILGHDLPIINGGLMELGSPSLPPKLVQDTKVHLVKRGIISASQENLSDMLGVQSPKIRMNDAKWREANRLTAKGIKLTKLRVVGDIHQHIQMRAKLLEHNLLTAPTEWRP